MKYSIVIPTFNHCDDFLKPCINSILQYSKISDVEIIISANGCIDNTFEYYGALKEKFNYLGLYENLKLVWSPTPLGYPKAVNEGIKRATTDRILMLNNDAIVIPNPRHSWLEILDTPFKKIETAGISGMLKKYSPITESEFTIFFCSMIHRKVIDKIGLLDEDFGVGGNEDIDYCKRAELAGFTIHQELPMTWSNEAKLFVGNFPIYHKGEGTMHDTKLITNWDSIFRKNELKLAIKYNIKWYNEAIKNSPYKELVTE